MLVSSTGTRRFRQGFDLQHPTFCIFVFCTYSDMESSMCPYCRIAAYVPNASRSLMPPQCPKLGTYHASCGMSMFRGCLGGV